MPPTDRPDVTAIVLTLNEELNLPFALRSVVEWARETVVLDSGSVDRTEAIAREFGCRFVHHKFEDYASQRNFAISQMGVEGEWIFFLDADEVVTPELRDDIRKVLQQVPSENGFYVKRRMMWLGRWIRHGGYYPKWILRLFRRDTGRCDDRKVNEHIVVQGTIGMLGGDLIHEDHKGVGDWIAKHNRYAALEAEIGFSGGGRVPDNVGKEVRKRLLLRRNLWDRLPLLVRPFAYFVYRYIFLLGFLDGSEGFIYHFLHALWYRLIIDVKLIELSHKRRRNTPAVKT